MCGLCRFSFESVIFHQNINEISTKFKENLWKAMKTMQSSIKIDEHHEPMIINENQRNSRSPNSLQGVTILTSIYTKGFHGLQATSCRLQATGGRLQATGNRLQARSTRAARSFRLHARGYKQQATSYRLQATGCRHHVCG